MKELQMMEPSYTNLLFMHQVKKNPSMDALLSDICIATSAAPTYLPTYYFETKDAEGKVREFNLTDGGVAANNPVYIFQTPHHSL
jgi:patatin-like phospholipase/acyl hydrolase